MAALLFRDVGVLERLEAPLEIAGDIGGTFDRRQRELDSAIATARGGPVRGGAA
jgi:hypothetical protein